MDTIYNILLLDDNEQSASEIQRFLKASSYEFNLNHASDVQEGANFVKKRSPDLILLDANMVNKADFVSFNQLTGKNDIPVILLSDMNASETREHAHRAGASDYLTKNKIDLFHLQKAIVNTLKISKTEAKLDTTVNQFNARHDAFYQLLNKINSAVLVINSANAMVYSNTRAYGVLSDEQVREHIAPYLTYRAQAQDEWIELKPNRKVSLSIRISNIEWDDAPANLFLVDRTVIETKPVGLADETFLTLLNSVKGNILLLKDRQIAFANKPALKIFNARPNDVLNRPLAAFIEPNETNPVITVGSLFNEKEASGIVKASDGSMQQVKFFTRPINMGDEFYELISFDIVSEQAEKSAPKQRSDEDRFSTDSVLHLASHDLREPVRTILNYVQLISDNLVNKKYEAASEYADFAKDAASRMEQLLSDLKVYISLSEYQFTLSKISMKSVGTDVLQQLKRKAEDTGAEINLAELPDVNADRELVNKLLYHLVDNAIKFRKKGKKPIVDIGYDKFEGNIIFCVRDNGIGISKRYYSHIFEAFERLNRVDEYTGNGLGLAICKKIVEMHGGEIWVESLPGSGSNFYFTLRSK